MIYFSRTVYRSLSQVLSVLNAPQVIKYPQVQELLKLAASQNLIETNEIGVFVVPNKVNQNDADADLKRNIGKPLIVIEGLDGSGKSTLTKYLQGKFNMELCVTPPTSLSEIPKLREFFDNQPEGIRRAFYSLGNYMAGQDIQSIDKPVIMDRFWHSTAAYAFAKHIKSGGQVNSFSDEDLSWPCDLIQPNLVIFLELSEKVRLLRHSHRKEFTNTAEEKDLAADTVFRENIKMGFKKISGVPFVVVNVDGNLKESKNEVSNCVMNTFPIAFNNNIEPEIGVKSVN